MNHGCLGLELQSVPTVLAACIWSSWGARTLDSGARAPEGGRPGLELPSSLSSCLQGQLPGEPGSLLAPCPPPWKQPWRSRSAALSCSWRGTQRSPAGSRAQQPSR